MATAIPKALVDDLVERGAGDAAHVRNMLRHLADAASDAASTGEDFTVPGIVKIKFAYKAPQKKGERWTKGMEVAGFGGLVSIKDDDSPATKARVTLKPSLTGDVYRSKPGSKPEAQALYLKTKVGKAVVKRLS